VPYPLMGFLFTPKQRGEENEDAGEKKDGDEEIKDGDEKDKEGEDGDKGKADECVLTEDCGRPV
jgi:hypothetical protein